MKPTSVVSVVVSVCMCIVNTEVVVQSLSFTCSVGGALPDKIPTPTSVTSVRLLLPVLRHFLKHKFTAVAKSEKLNANARPIWFIATVVSLLTT